MHFVPDPRRGGLAGVVGSGIVGGADARRRRGDFTRLAPVQLDAVAPIVVHPDLAQDGDGGHRAQSGRGMHVIDRCEQPPTIVPDGQRPGGTSCGRRMRRVRNSLRTEASKPGAVSSRRRTYVRSMRLRTACAAWRSESPSAHWRSVTSASRQGGRAGGPGVGNRAQKASSVTSVFSASASRRYRLPLGNAARATRTVSVGMGSIGIGRSVVHLRGAV